MRRVIAIVVVLALIAGGAYYFLHDNSAAEEICYDDYIESPAAVSADGSLEIVTLSGMNYIHAVGVGTGSVEFSNGSVETHVVKKALLDVYLLLGQSNAQYYFSNILEDSVKTEPGTAYTYGIARGTPIIASSYNSETMKRYCSIHSMNDLNGDQLISNLEAPLAANLHNFSGNKILVLNGAVSGAKMETYLPGEINFTRASVIFNDAVESIDRDLFEPRIKSYIWVQGESDYGTEVEQYKTWFIEMHDDLTGIGIFSDYKFDAAFISLVRATSPTIAQIQLILDPGTSVILGATSAQSFSIDAGTLQSDGVHYTQLGDNILGSELAESIADYYLRRL